MRRGAALLPAAALLVFCNQSARPVAHVTVAAPSASSSTPLAQSVAVQPPRWRPFAFVHGRPDATLGDYAVHYWGANGASVFTSAASVRRGDVAGGPGDETLIEVGQYAVVDVPERSGFFVRDFGEGGWVEGIEARAVSGGPKKDVVIRYRVRDADEAAKQDWARWQQARSRIPEVNAVSHMVIEVWSFAELEPAMLFVHEVEAWALCCGSEVGPAPPRVSDDVELGTGRIILRVRDAWRADGASWHEVGLPDVPVALVPWAGVKSRTFRFEMSRNAFVEP